jgi:hypothetical protein
MAKSQSNHCFKTISWPRADRIVTRRVTASSDALAASVMLQSNRILGVPYTRAATQIAAIHNNTAKNANFFLQDLASFS